MATKTKTEKTKPAGVISAAASAAKMVAAEAAKTVAAEVKKGRLDRLALWITERVGTMVFFLIIFVWTVTWLLWNTVGPKGLRFDPFPGFVLWLFISNMIQLFLMPLIMIGQNLQGRGAEERAKNDYKVNLKAEKEIQEIQERLSMIVAHLEEINSAMAPRE